MPRQSNIIASLLDWLHIVVVTRFNLPNYMISVHLNISSVKYICLFLSKIQLPDVIYQNFKFSECALNEEHALLMCCNPLKLGVLESPRHAQKPLYNRIFRNEQYNQRFVPLKNTANELQHCQHFLSVLWAC